MAFGVRDTNATWSARAAADLCWPAIFLYLDWPTGVIRASTFPKPVTAGGEDWVGVGAFASFESAPMARSGALVTYRVGLTSIPQDAITDETEAAAIGRDAIIYFGFAAEGWTDFQLRQQFRGTILNAGDIKDRRGEDGRWVTNATIDISNGRSPRRQVETHHSRGTAAPGDTAARHLPLVDRAMTWPTIE